MPHDPFPPRTDEESRVAVHPGNDGCGPSHADLAALLEINQALSGHRDREGLLAAIGGALESLLPVDRVLLLVPGAQGADASVYAVRGCRTLTEGERVPERSAPGWVMRERTPFVVSSPEEVGERFPTTREQLAAEGMRSALVLPLLVQERCIGALCFMAPSAGAYDRCSPRLLDGIGSAVTVALDTCLAYERLERLGQERKALLDVTTAIGRHLERDELFGAMAVCLRNLVPTERFGIELPIEGDRLQGHLLTPRGAAAEPTRPTILQARHTACNWVLQHRQWLVAASRDELEERFPVTFAVMAEAGMESLCAVPLISGERCRGVLFFMAARRGAYGDLRRDFLDQVAAAVAVALDDCLVHEEVRRLRDRLAAENVYLQEEILQEHNFGEIVGRSPALRQVLSQVETAAPTNATVLILGETGTGKELIARAIHERSARRDRPLVKVNCAAISAGLVESELFGHVKGAFTGAVAARSGRFELANGGTIFLDEIGDLPPETQVKLLRVLQEREFEPVGSGQTRRVDVRLIAATNRDLGQAVAEGRFRSDLFYRVNVLPIRVPALRERREDIPLLVHFFVDRFGREMAKPVQGVSRQAMEQLTAYDWPGNVRELQNIVERAMVLANGPVLELGPDFALGAPRSPRPLPGDGDALAATPADALPAEASSSPMSLAEASRQHILRVLEDCGGVIEGPQGAALRLGMRPSTLRSRLKKLVQKDRAPGATA